MHRPRRVTSTTTVLALSLFSGCVLAQRPSPAAAQTSDNVIYLNQAWSQDDREWYYHFSQGSAAPLSYEIFLNLEAAGSQQLFRSDSNIVRYGLIPEPANSFNPDGLPIGISKTTVAVSIEGWVTPMCPRARKDFFAEPPMTILAAPTIMRTYPARMRSRRERFRSARRRPRDSDVQVEDWLTGAATCAVPFRIRRPIPLTKFGHGGSSSSGASSTVASAGGRDGTV
jgi:hypothetical protein